MKTIEVNLYSFSELSEKAKEKAKDYYYNELEDYSYLSELLESDLCEILQKNKIKNFESKIYYSLSFSQGDGVCFTGEFEFKNYNVKIIKSRHNYCHYRSVDINIIDIETGEYIDENSEVYREFLSIYRNICDELKKTGYSIIEYRADDKEFSELSDSNDWYYYENGDLYN